MTIIWLMINTAAAVNESHDEVNLSWAQFVLNLTHTLINQGCLSHFNLIIS